MEKRGYPSAEFEQSAADLSVHYPHLVTDYRAASQIAESIRRGVAKTEELRQALVHYRALFRELLQGRKPAVNSREAVPTKAVVGQRPQSTHT